MSDDDPIEQLREKTRGSAVSALVEGALNDPRVQRTIQRAIIKQTVKHGFILSSILLGGMSLLNYVKTTYTVPWIDLYLGIACIAIGVLALARDWVKD